MILDFGASDPVIPSIVWLQARGDQTGARFDFADAFSFTSRLEGIDQLDEAVRAEPIPGFTKVIIQTLLQFVLRTRFQVPVCLVNQFRDELLGLHFVSFGPRVAPLGREKILSCTLDLFVVVDPKIPRLDGTILSHKITPNLQQNIAGLVGINRG